MGEQVVTLESLAVEIASLREELAPLIELANLIKENPMAATFLGPGPAEAAAHQ